MEVLMRASRLWTVALVAFPVTISLTAAPAQSDKAPGQPVASSPANAMLDGYKKEAVADIDRLHEFTQQMVDQVFSCGELGFQELETSKSLTDILRKDGVSVQEGLAGRL